MKANGLTDVLKRTVSESIHMIQSATSRGVLFITLRSIVSLFQFPCSTTMNNGCESLEPTWTSIAELMIENTIYSLTLML
jgi:hypothetical protein